MGIPLNADFRRPTTNLSVFGPPDTVLDIGANRGESIARFRRLWPEARILSFEPRPDSFSELERAAEADGNARAFNFGLSDKQGKACINWFPKAEGGSSLLASTETLRASRPWPDKTKPVPIDLKRLDGLALELDLPLIVKIDVQGYECRVLRGGLETVARAKAIEIEVGIEPLYEAQGSLAEVDSLLAPLGFSFQGPARVVRRGKAGILSWIDAVWAKE